MGVGTLLLALVAVGQTGASFDAAEHALVARGAAAADLRAPSAQVARVKAERQARGQAEKRLLAALKQLGWKPGADAQADKLLETVTVSDERYGSDGSVELKLTLSTKALDLKKR
ncbi:MAG TPA: hypothetical protein VMZ28_08995 [Kofleriaceae bacterium]|nr:hypothetical protein [Kofleriaceae bacterium]